jgi:hypothetical protein
VVHDEDAQLLLETILVDDHVVEHFEFEHRVVFLLQNRQGSLAQQPLHAQSEGRKSNQVGHYRKRLLRSQLEEAEQDAPDDGRHEHLRDSIEAPSNEWESQHTEQQCNQKQGCRNGHVVLAASRYHDGSNGAVDVEEGEAVGEASAGVDFVVLR